MAISKIKGVKVSKLANKVNRIEGLDSIFVGLMITFFNFAIAEEKKYDEKIFATGTVSIVKQMMGSQFLAGFSAHSYYRYILVSEMIFRFESILSLVGSWSAYIAGSKSLGISHLHDVGLYTATTKELLILFRASSNFVMISN